MAKDQYVVTGEYVLVKTTTDRGPMVVGLYRGAPWPDDATDEATQHHLDSGLIGKVGEPAKVPPVGGEPMPAAQDVDAPVGEPAGPKPGVVEGEPIAAPASTRKGKG